MPDDILKDAIQTFHEELGALQAEGKSYDDEDAGNASVGRIKKKFDEKWSPYWHVVVGRSYGAFATHEDASTSAPSRSTTDAVMSAYKMAHAVLHDLG